MSNTEIAARIAAAYASLGLNNISVEDFAAAKRIVDENAMPTVSGATGITVAATPAPVSNIKCTVQGIMATHATSKLASPEVKPTESKPVESKSASESKPVESKSASESKPVESKSASESKPVESKSVAENKLDITPDSLSEHFENCIPATEFGSWVFKGTTLSTHIASVLARKILAGDVRGVADMPISSYCGLLACINASNVISSLKAIITKLKTSPAAEVGDCIRYTRAVLSKYAKFILVTAIEDDIGPLVEQIVYLCQVRVFHDLVTLCMDLVFDGLMPDNVKLERVVGDHVAPHFMLPGNNRVYLDAQYDYEIMNQLM